MPSDHRSGSGRTAIVTGGGSGIGRAIAVELAGRGLDVLIVGRRESALSETTMLQGGIRAFVADVAVPEECPGIVDAALAIRGRLDVLVNNAGVAQPARLGQVVSTDAQRLWATNVLAPIMLTRAAMPHLIENRGSVVNISSTFGAKPAPGMSMYGATKAALEQLTRSWALEVARDGVRVNAVAPGPTESEALEATGASPEEIQSVLAAELETIPLGRRGDPAEVAWWVAALAEPNGWITGQILGVDGGYLLA